MAATCAQRPYMKYNLSCLASRDVATFTFVFIILPRNVAYVNVWQFCIHGFTFDIIVDMFNTNLAGSTRFGTFFACIHCEINKSTVI